MRRSSTCLTTRKKTTKPGEVELTENEYRAAQGHKSRYFLYRVFVHPNDPTRFEIAILQDPINSNAVRLVTRFDLVEGSVALWYTLDEVFEEQEGNGDDQDGA